MKTAQIKAARAFPFARIHQNETIGLLFDVDELLINNRNEIQKAYQRLVELMSGLTCSDCFEGENLFEILKKMKLKYGMQNSVEELAEKRREIYLDILRSSQIQPSPGVRELFEFLENWRNRLNVVIGYVSSSEKAFLDIVMKKLFQTIGLARYKNDADAFFCYGTEISVSTCWEKGIEKKPSPQLYEMTISKMKLDPSQCIAFEDSLSGSRAALEAGTNLIIIQSSMPFPSNELAAQYKGRVHQMNSMLDFVPYMELLPKQLGALR